MSLVDTFAHAALYGVPALTALTAVGSGFFTNGQQQEALITRFGKHTRTVKSAGLHFKVPFIDKITERIDTDVQQAAETLETKTKDDLFVKLPISVQFEITDTPLYYFKNRDADANMMKSVSAAVRTATAGKDFQELYTDRDELSGQVISHIKDQVAEFGINIRRIIIDEPTAPLEVQNAFNDVRASERLKEAARNKAEATRITLVAESEAAATAQANAGKGAADFRKAIFEGYEEQLDKLTLNGKLTTDQAFEIVMKAMTLDAIRDVAKHGNTVIVPQSFTGDDFAKMQALRSVTSKPPESAPTPMAA